MLQRFALRSRLGLGVSVLVSVGTMLSLGPLVSVAADGASSPPAAESAPPSVSPSAPPSEPPSPPAAAPAVRVGLLFEKTQTFNEGTLLAVQYVGRCPGEAAGALQARFISSKTPPAPGLRVLIRNVSDLVEGQPYTDRKYESGKFSESFWVALDNDHHQRFLSLLSGENNLEYQIKQGETVLEAGTFQVKVSNETAVVSRSGYWVEEPWDYCSHWRGRRCLRYGREYRSVLRCP